MLSAHCPAIRPAVLDGKQGLGEKGVCRSSRVDPGGGEVVNSAFCYSVSLVLIGLAWSLPGQAMEIEQCDYSWGQSTLEVTEDWIELRKPDTGPVRFGEGRMDYAGERVNLSDAEVDRARIYESEVRRIIEEFRVIAREAVEIAAYASTQTITAVFGPSVMDGLEEDFEGFRQELEAEIEATREFDATGIEAELERKVEAFVLSIMPKLSIAVARTALSSILAEPGSGDPPTGVEGLEERIEAEIEARAEPLRARVEALCPRLEKLHDLESEFEDSLEPAYRFRFIRRDPAGEASAGP